MTTILILVVILASVFTIKSSSDPQISVDSLCIINQNHECVGNKEKAQVKKVDDLVGYYAIDEKDLRKIITKLEQCKNK